MRPVVRALAAACLAAAVLVLAVPAVQASAREVQQPSARTNSAASPALTISIDKMTPQWVTPTNSTVTVSGTLSNHTGSPVSGIVVQAQTSYSNFPSRSQLESFASSGAWPYNIVNVTQGATMGTVANGATVRWSLSFDAGAYYTAPSEVVYPVWVQASAPASGYQATARTLLPYWPANGIAKRLRVAWIWPLISAPQQGACSRTLTTPALSRSLAAGGRLSRLLGAGLTGFGPADQLTWAIDPALLSDAKVMTRRYFTGGNSVCRDRAKHGASAAAAEWLSQLADTAGQPAFLTPYANVDAAALSHAGLDADLRSAYQLGRQVAGNILPGTFGTAGYGTGNGSVLAAAWPADGTADAGVLTSLATAGGITTMVLKSGALRSSTWPYDDARARTTTRTGMPVSVLLADSGLTALLGSASSRSPAAARFAVTQGFIATTAMIVAEAPSRGRTLVVAPPPGWAPSESEAAALLKATHEAQWLQPTGLGKLAEDATRVPARSLPAKRVSHAELSGPYLNVVRSARANLDLFSKLLYRPPAGEVSALRSALAVTESSAWRGAGSPGGWLAVTKFAYYLSDEEHKVQLIASRKILLAGTSGTTPVSVQNRLDRPIQVRVQASTPLGSKLSVGPLGRPLVVAAGGTGTVRMPVHSGAIGTATMKLELATRNGAPLTWTRQPLSVEVTRFGRAVLLVIGGALAVLVLTAGVRLRRRRRSGGRHEGDSENMHGADVSAGAGGAG